MTTFVNCTLFDGTNDQNTPNAWFTVDKTGRLTARGTGTPADAENVVDLGGQYVMPGFLNVHTHVTADPQSFNGNYGQTEAEAAVFATQNLQTLLKSGVTFLRQCGTKYDVDVALKRMQSDGKLPHTPHFLTSGRAFTMTGGTGMAPIAVTSSIHPTKCAKPFGRPSSLESTVSKSSRLGAS